VIVVGLLGTGLLSLALATAGAYWQLLVLLVLLGLVAGSYHAPAAALLARSFPQQVRGAALGLHITGGHISLFATPVAAGLLVAASDTWRTSYLWLAAAPLLTALLVWRLRVPSHSAHAESREHVGIVSALVETARAVGPLVLISIVFQMLHAAILAFMALYLVDARGLPPAQAAAYVGAPQVIGVLGSPFGGYLSDRLGRRAVILTGMVLVGPAFYAMTVAPLELLPLVLMGIGFASALRQTVTEVLVMDSAPPRRRAMVMGSYYMAFQQLGGIAAPLLGVLAGLIGIGASFSAVTLTLAIASVVVLLVHRRLL
jgi:MFS family permease